ncbi:MAG: pimeloyl-ACP methyl esterase BioG family protein [Rikenellaceae bacterium]
MKLVKLIEQSPKSSRLLIFFAGWASDENPFKDLKASNCDVVMLYDYRSMDSAIELLNSKISRYDRVDIVAWSMGVWAASYSIDKMKLSKKYFSSATAINGTLEPIHSEYGIAPEIFKATVANLPEGMPRFNLRMCGSKSQWDRYNSMQPQRSTLELKEELISIGEQVKLVDSIEWNRAIIASKDLIITTKNQHNFWEYYQTNYNHNLEIKSVDGAHFIFDIYKKWEDIIDG